MTDLPNKRIVKTPRQEIAVQLRQLALERGPGAKLPTTRELSDMFGTSLPTLNAVLDELESVSVISRKDRSGIYVSPRLLCNNIAILVDARIIATPGMSPFWNLLLTLCLEEAQKRSTRLNESYRLQIVPHTDGQLASLPTETINEVVEKRINGVITIGLEGEHPLFDDPTFPMVAFGGNANWSVAHDEGRLASMGVRSLVEQGCERIEMWRSTFFGHDYREIPDPGNYRPSTVQKTQYEDELIACGLNPNVHPIRDFRSQSLSGQAVKYQDQGALLANIVFSENRATAPDGLLIVDDMVASGALYALREMGVRPGIDVKIATHANAGSTLLYGYEKDLTLLEVDPKAIALAMFRVLDDVMAGIMPGDKVYFVPPRIRDSFTLPKGRNQIPRF